MISKHLKNLCKKYTEGYEAERQKGKHIKPNPQFNYIGYTEYMLKRKRYGTVRMYLSYLHKWYLPINKKNLIDFDTSIEMIDEWRHEYNNKNKNYVHSYLNKTGDQIIDSMNRLTYMVYNSLKSYMEYSKDENIKYLPLNKKIPKPYHNIKKGHFTEQEFIRFNEFTNNKVLFNLLFYTGARISELLHLKKNKEWFPIYDKNKKIIVKEGEVFKIIIPRQYSKAKEEQKLYIYKKENIKSFINFLNDCKDNNYVFRLDKKTKNNKSFNDVEREKSLVRLEIIETLKKCGLSHYIDEITIHSFRRGFIHYIYEKFDKDIEFTNKVARHESGIEMTGKYLKTSDVLVNKKLKEKFM